MYSPTPLTWQRRLQDFDVSLSDNRVTTFGVSVVSCHNRHAQDRFCSLPLRKAQPIQRNCITFQPWNHPQGKCSRSVWPSMKEMWLPSRLLPSDSLYFNGFQDSLVKPLADLSWHPKLMTPIWPVSPAASQARNGLNHAQAAVR